MTGTLLCVLASPALAGDHYVEIWNPPEARQSDAHSPLHAAKPHVHHLAKRKLASNDARLAPRKVAEPAMRAPASTPGLPQGTPNDDAPATNRLAIPPAIGPDGNIMQVGYGVPARHGGGVQAPQ